MNVSLTDEQVRFIEERVKTGRYRSAADVVREALQILMRQQLDESPEHVAWREKVRRQIDEGLEEADRGELLDGRQVFEEARKRLQSGRKRRR
jgi:antitoxin ParD1/3/4